MTCRLFFFSVAVAFSPVLSFAQSALIDCNATYTVAPGDTLSKISTKAYGVSAFEVIYDANKEAIGENPNRLFVGQKLIVPCRTARTETTASTTTETQDARAADGPVTLTFNKASDKRFVINSGIIDPYLDLIEVGTEGRVRFVDPEEMNRTPAEQLDLVTSGKVDATYVYNGYLAESHPLLQLPMFPLMGGSAEQTAISLWNLHDQYLSKTAYFDDAHVLGFIAAPAAHIWHGKSRGAGAGQNLLEKNVYAVPYFEGLDTIGPQRVRELNAVEYADLSEELGEDLTFMMAHGAARGAGIWNDMRKVTEVENGIYTPTFSVVISNEAWARISPKDQAIINQLSGLVLSKRSSAWDDFDNGHRRVMLDTGLVVEYPDGPFLRELEGAAQAQLAAWSGDAAQLGIPASQAIAAYRADLASLRYLLIYR